MIPPSPLTGSEAVYGFAGWLTSRDDLTVMGASRDAAPIVELVDRFCKVNSLEEPRDGWENNLNHPLEGAA